MDPVTAALLRFARSIVQSVISQIIQQSNIIRDGVLEPGRTIVQMVTDGVWRGAGADRFVEEMNSVCLPMVQRLIEALLGINTNVNQCINIIDEADQTVKNIVGGLDDLFKSVF